MGILDVGDMSKKEVGEVSRGRGGGGTGEDYGTAGDGGREGVLLTSGQEWASAGVKGSLMEKGRDWRRGTRSRADADGRHARSTSWISMQDRAQECSSSR